MNVESEAVARDPRTHAVIGAALEVHNVLGCGFLEPVYQHALARELGIRAIPFVREAELPVHYKGSPLDCGYRADFICYGEVIVEIKALFQLTGIEHAQVIDYLKAASLPVALLVNFGTQRLEFRRFVNS